MNSLSTWKELQNIELAFFPIGSHEQHGHHLPLSTDSIIATAIANKLAMQFPNSFIVPTLPYSASFEHAKFPGSISLRMTTIISVVQDVVHSLERSGVKRTVIINGHGGNMLLGNIAQEMNVDQPRLIITPNRKHWDKAYELAGLSTTLSRDMHAGEGETSILLHLMEEGIVRMQYFDDVDSPLRPLLEVVGMKQYTHTGVIGFPTRASKEKGQALLHHLVDQISITVKEFLKLT